jgi:hypothetical protein
MVMAVMLDRLPPPAQQAILDNGLGEVIVDILDQQMSWTYERKVLRLTERLRDMIQRGEFGPLSVPNTLDENGMPIPTPAGGIAMALADIYTPEFLDMFDEEGNLLAPPVEGG